MTDRYNALIVVLDRDIRSDDAQPIMNAIRQIKHVLSVDGHVSDINSVAAKEAVRADLTARLWNALTETDR